MPTSPSLAVKLYGSEQAVEPMRTLRAGPLTAQFDQGALRYIKLNGVEAIRNIAFVVRDKDWGTYNPRIENLKIEQQDDGFSVSYDATCQDDRQELRYTAAISGQSDGTLRFTGKGEAVTDFLTNRTGFVVLHPVAGVSGYPVEVERVDGSVEHTQFPERVDPVQPFKDIRALTHEVLPGVRISCRMEGDTFEMEDHRQWNDASYKTYVRPIGLPWPYTLSAGETVEQSVTLTVQGKLAPRDAEAGRQPIAIALGDAAGTMPRIGLGLEPQHTPAALQHVDLIRRIGPQILVCWFDLREKHGVEELRGYKELGDRIGAELVLEAVIPCDDYRAEIDRIAAQCQQVGILFAAVSVSPSAYLKSIMPGSQWPDVPALEDLYDAVRAAFPGTTLGGGMFAFFPELNRKRPPSDKLDYITHTSNTITHACDDITVTENLEALPYIIKTCRSFAGGKPYRVGPSAIAMRFNPYGSKTMDNPNNERIAMARMDPRQRGLLNAAWTLGYVAHLARGGIEVVTLQAPVGEFGLIYHRMDWPQPWYDDAGGDAKVYPAFHVVAGLAAAAGKPLLRTDSSFSHDVECVAYRDGDNITLWVANLSNETRRITVEGVGGSASFRTLDADTFERCAMDPDGFTAGQTPAELAPVFLSPYAVVRIDIGQ